jgi:hypothetical protein
MQTNIHDRARRLANERGITIEAARSELGRRGASARSARRRRVLGTMSVTCADLAASSGIESPRYRLPYADL